MRVPGKLIVLALLPALALPSACASSSPKPQEPPQAKPAKRPMRDDLRPKAAPKPQPKAQAKAPEAEVISIELSPEEEAENVRLAEQRRQENLRLEQAMAEASRSAGQGGPESSADMDAAFERARNENKPIVAEFRSARSPVSQQMDLQTFNDPRVGSWLDANAIFLRIDVDARPDLVQAGGIQTVPTVILFDSAANEVNRFSGLVLPDDFLRWADAYAAEAARRAKASRG